MKRDLPAYCRRVRSRGKVYIYFERAGFRQRIPHEPGTPEFAREYARLLSGRPVAPATRSVTALIQQYRASDKYASLAVNTRKYYSRSLDYLADRLGPADPAKIRPVHVQDMVNAWKDQPGTGNQYLGVMQALMRFAVQTGWIDRSPAERIRRLPPAGEGREPWPADKIKAFRSIAEGDDLLIFEMLLGTGQRIGDVLRMQWAHVEGSGINVRQSKTGRELWVPWTRRLADLIAATPRRGLFIACRKDGRPYPYGTIQTRFLKMRRQIGAEAWDIHGLRHSAASELAALGLSDEHIMAVTGHGAHSMVRLYAEKAAQRARAEEAQGKRT